MAKPSRPKDTNQRAKFILDIVTGEAKQENINGDKNPNAVELGRLGGLKGGKARADKLTAEERKKIAAKAAKKRWG